MQAFKLCVIASWMVLLLSSPENTVPIISKCQDVKLKRPQMQEYTSGGQVKDYKINSNNLLNGRRRNGCGREITTVHVEHWNLK